LANFLIDGSTAIITKEDDAIYFYDYPSGKYPILTIKEPEYSAYGVAISVARTGSHIRT